MRKLALLGLVAAIQLGRRRPPHWLLDAHLRAVFPGSPQQTLHHISARWSARSDFRRHPPRFHGEVGRT